MAETNTWWAYCLMSHTTMHASPARLFNRNTSCSVSLFSNNVHFSSCIGRKTWTPDWRRRQFISLVSRASLALECKKIKRCRIVRRHNYDNFTPALSANVSFKEFKQITRNRTDTNLDYMRQGDRNPLRQNPLNLWPLPQFMLCRAQNVAPHYDSMHLILMTE